MPCSQMSYKDREGLLPFPSFLSAPKPKMLFERILGVSPTCSFLPRWKWASGLSISPHLRMLVSSPRCHSVSLEVPQDEFLPGLSSRKHYTFTLWFAVLTCVYCSDTAALYSLFTRELRVVSPPWLMYMLVYTPSLSSLFPSSCQSFFSLLWFF